MNPAKHPSEIQLTTLCGFAKLNGRTWKSKLRYCWESGNWNSSDIRLEGLDYCYLQQIRNSFGPTWLMRFRLPAEVAGNA